MKTVEQYLELPYHVSVTRGDEKNGGAWSASVEEFPDCSSSGPTPEEAVRRLRRSMSRWIADALQNERDVPEPRRETTASGRLLVRMPRTLHAELAAAADREGVSLNQFITGALAGTVRWRSGAPAGVQPVAGSADPAAPRTTRLVRLVLAANYLFMAAAATIAVIALVIAVR